MATPQPLQSAFAQQPASLSDGVPVPEKPDTMSMAVDLPAMDMDGNALPQEAAQGAAPAAEPGAMAAGFSPEAMELMQSPMEEIPSEQEQTLPESAMEQGREAWTRFRHAWTSSDTESMETLKDSGLFDDVKLGKDGEMRVKRRGDKGFTKFDRKGVQVIGDVLDMSRIAFEGVAENVMKVPAVGAAVIGTGGIAAPAAAGASAMAGLYAGDIVAEHVIGIKRDPERSMPLELALAAGFGASFSAVGSSLGRVVAKNKALRKQSALAVDIAKNKINTAKEMVETVRGAGVELKPHTGEVFITPNQATMGSVPEFTILEKELSKQSSFRNFKEVQGEALKDGYDALVDTIARGAGRSSQIGKDFQLKFEDIGDFYGKEIGRFRQVAKDNIKGPLPAKKTSDAITGIMKSINEGTTGILNASGAPMSGVRTKIGNIQSNFPGLTADQAGVVLNTLERLEKKVVNGNMNINDVDAIYTTMREQIDASARSVSGKPVADALVNVKNALRDDYADMIGTVLPPDQVQAYKGFMGRYSEFKQGEAELRNLLKDSALSRSALVSKLFEGKNSLGMAKSVRTLMNSEDPKFFRELSVEYFQKLRNDFTEPGANGAVNWTGLSKKFKKLGDEKDGMQDLLLQGAGLTKKEFNSMTGLGLMYQKTDFKALPMESKLNVFKKIWLLSPWAKSGGAAKANAATSLVEGIGKDQSLMKYLKDGGFEEMLKQMPGNKQGKAAQAMAWISEWKPVNTGAKGIVKAAPIVQRRESIEEANQ